MLCTLFVVSLLLTSHARANVLGIRECNADAPGTYLYPLDANRRFTPGYFYAPSDGNVTFRLSSRDGGTLHLFDDAEGSAETVLPEGLLRPDAPNSPSGYVQEGEVYVTQGWHKLYVACDMLSVQNESVLDNSFCQLEWSEGILYDKV